MSSGRPTRALNCGIISPVLGIYFMYVFACVYVHIPHGDRSPRRLEEWIRSHGKWVLHTIGSHHTDSWTQILQKQKVLLTLELSLHSKRSSLSCFLFCLLFFCLCLNFWFWFLETESHCVALIGWQHAMLMKLAQSLQ